MLENELVSQLSHVAERLGAQLDGDTAELRTYAAERMRHLSTIIGEQGYHYALQAETVNVALVAAGSAVDTADDIDKEIIGFIGGMIAMGARALAPV